MRVLITSDWNTHAINGVATSIKNLMTALRDRGHEVRILSLSSTGETIVTEDGWEASSLPANFVYPGARVRFWSTETIYEQVIEWRPDIIHTQCELASFMMAKRISHRLGGLPIVHTYHTVYEDYTQYVLHSQRLGNKIVKDASKLLSEHVNAIIAPTTKVKTLLESYDCKCTIEVLPTGLDLNHLRQQLSEDERHSLQFGLGLDPNKKTALYLGRIAKEKNLDEILDYFSKIDMENEQLLIVGGGPYLEEIKKHPEAKNAIFAGMVKPDDVWKYYSLGDYFVSASTSETQGLTYIEALSCGLPLLCRKDDCLEDVVIEGENGYLFKNEQEFLENHEKMIDKLCNISYNRLEVSNTAEKFSLKHFGEEAERIYGNCF